MPPTSTHSSSHSHFLSLCSPTHSVSLSYVVWIERGPVPALTWLFSLKKKMADKCICSVIMKMIIAEGKVADNTHSSYRSSKYPLLFSFKFKENSFSTARLWDACNHQVTYKGLKYFSYPLSNPRGNYHNLSCFVCFSTNNSCDPKHFVFELSVNREHLYRISSNLGQRVTLSQEGTCSNLVIKG